MMEETLNWCDVLRFQSFGIQANVLRQLAHPQVDISLSARTIQGNYQQNSGDWQRNLRRYGLPRPDDLSELRFGIQNSVDNSSTTIANASYSGNVRAASWYCVAALESHPSSLGVNCSGETIDLHL